MILLRLGWWIRGWGDPFPYSCEEISRNPQCLQNFCTSLKTLKIGNATPSVWIPPPLNHFEWNVDASFDPTLSRAAVGGVLRDDFGHFVCIFSSPIPCMEINSTEVFAILRSIKITMSYERSKSKNIIIEPDSKKCSPEVYRKFMRALESWFPPKLHQKRQDLMAKYLNHSQREGVKYGCGYPG